MELTPFLFGLYKLVKYGLYPLSWVFFLMALTTWLLLLPFNPRRLRWARITSTCALLLFLIISSPLLARPLLSSLEAWYPMPTFVKDTHYDAIVVLGGGILEQGTLRQITDLTSYSKNRTICGVDLYEQGYADKLVLTGGNEYPFKDVPKNALVMKRWAQRLGIPEHAIVTEENSRTTYENATGAKELLGSASILLVSSASHLPRAAALFTKQGFQVTPVPCDFLMQDRPEDSWRRLDPFDFLPNDRAIEHTTAAVTEWAGMAIYWLTGKL
jgi:uncharacterized SAM-binding protein YcdF (DUF218 family)